MLQVGKFYLQRPAVLVENTFNLVKVVRLILNEEGEGGQWGAYVHPWEVSTVGGDVDYFSDPWHASAFHKENQRYNATKLPPAQQATTWTFPMSQMNEFQCEVPMNGKWAKPKGFTKTLGSGYGVMRRRITNRFVSKIRNLVYRWNEEEDDAEEEVDWGAGMGEL